MYRYAIIENNAVENIMLVSEDYVPPVELTAVQVDDTVCIGYTYNDGKFSPPVYTPTVPNSVTPLQMRKALRAVGLKTAVEAYINAMADEEALEEWEYALAVERNNPMLNAAALQLGMTGKQVDDLFLLAASMT